MQQFNILEKKLSNGRSKKCIILSFLFVYYSEQGWILDRQTESKFLSYYQMESAYNKTVQYGLALFLYFSVDLFVFNLTSCNVCFCQ